MRQPIMRWTLAAVACLAVLTVPAAAAATADPPAAGSRLEAILVHLAEEVLDAWAEVRPMVAVADSSTGATNGPEVGEGSAEILDGGACEPGTTEHGCSIDPDG